MFGIVNAGRASFFVAALGENDAVFEQWTCSGAVKSDGGRHTIEKQPGQGAGGGGCSAPRVSIADGWAAPMGVKLDNGGGSALGDECLGLASPLSLSGSKHTVFGATNLDGTFSTSI